MTTRTYRSPPDTVSGGRDRDDPQTLDLETLYVRHAPDLSRLILRLCGPADAADVLHEVFLVAQRRLPEFRGEASVRTWLYGIALRVASARRRRQRLRHFLWIERHEAEPAEAVDPTTPERELESRDAMRRVASVLERLSERDRALLLLFELEGLSASEIARIVASTERGVWAGLHRARARFRKLFVELFGSEGIDG